MSDVHHYKQEQTTWLAVHGGKPWFTQAKLESMSDLSLTYTERREGWPDAEYQAYKEIRSELGAAQDQVDAHKPVVH